MNSSNIPNRSLLFRPCGALLALFVVVGLSTRPAPAATFDYTGSGGTTTSPNSGHWSTAASWDGGTAPTSSLDNVLTFGGSGNGTYTSTANIGSTFDLNQIILNSSSTDLSTIKIQGTTLNFLNNTAASGPRITQNGTGNFLFTGKSTLTDTLTIDGTGTGIMEFSTSEAFSGTGGIIMSGAGVLKLSEYNSFTGGLTINSGTVDAGYGNTNRLGNNAVTLAGGTLILSNTGGNWGYASTTVTADSTMVSNRNGAGVGGTNSLNGPLSIGAQTLTVEAGSLVTSGTAGLKFNNGTTLTGNAIFSVDTATQLQLGVITGANHKITKSGAGELLLSGDSTTVDEFIVNGGTLSTGSGNNLDSTVALTINNGTLYLSEPNIPAGAVTLVNGSITGAVGATLNGTSYDVRNGSVSRSLGGIGAALSKTTGGTVTLSADNTYTGDTLIYAGTLLVNGSLDASSYVGVDAATLGGTGTVGGVNTGGSTSVLSPGDSGVGTLTMSAANLDAGASFDFELGTFSDLLAVTGQLTGSSAAGGLTFNFSDSGGLAAGTPYTLLTFGSQSGLDSTDFASGSIAPGFALDTSFGTNGYLINAGDIQVQFIPEPSTSALLLGAATLLLGLRKRRRS